MLSQTIVREERMRNLGVSDFTWRYYATSWFSFKLGLRTPLKKQMSEVALTCKCERKWALLQESFGGRDRKAALAKAKLCIQKFDDLVMNRLSPHGNVSFLFSAAYPGPEDSRVTLKTTLRLHHQTPYLWSLCKRGVGVLTNNNKSISWTKCVSALSKAKSIIEPLWSVAFKTTPPTHLSKTLQFQTPCKNSNENKNSNFPLRIS